MVKHKKRIAEGFVSSLFITAAKSENQINLLDSENNSEYYQIGDTVIIDKEPFCILSVNSKEVYLENESFPMEHKTMSSEDFLKIFESPKKIKGYEPCIKSDELNQYIGAEYENNGRKYKIVKIDATNVVVEDLTMLSVLNVCPQQTFSFDEVFPLLKNVNLKAFNSKKTEHRKLDVITEKTEQQTDVNSETSIFNLFSINDKPIYKNQVEVLSNYRITDEQYKTKGERIKANLSAVNLIHKLKEEKRNATVDEQSILAQYSGWGGLNMCFDDKHSMYEKVIKTLSKHEYKEARASILTAFYTPVNIINLIYDVLIKAGFKGGRVLEPSCGTGKFFGCMPEAVMNHSILYGVEIDSLTAEIAKQLYPNATIMNTGFEKTKYSDNLFDICISNVPYGEDSPCDSKYNNLHLSLHDYFICKMIDLVRPGGITVALTSHFTMDKENNKARTYISKKADLIGAVRLPDNIFKGTHATPVTDILFFKKKLDVTVQSNTDWLEVTHEEFDGVKDTINSYFINNPSNILGKRKVISGPYGPVVTVSDNGNKITSLPVSFVYTEREDKIESKEKVVMELPEELIETPNFSYVSIDNVIWFRENELLSKVESKNETAGNRIRALITLRDILLELINAQVKNKSDDVIKEFQERLSYLYDNFVYKYGRISSRANSLAFREDSKYPLLCSLEVFNDDNEYVGKADVFTKRTIKIEAEPMADNPNDALSVSIAEKGGIDFEYMQELTGKTKEEIISSLLADEEIYKVPFENKYETRAWYLSGYVKEKLKAAKIAAADDKQYEVNVKALEAVQPKDIPYNEIFACLGSTWIPVKYYEEFMHKILETPQYAKNSCNIIFMNDKYHVTDKSIYTVRATSVMGTDYKNGYELFEDALNLIPTKVYDYYLDDDGKKKSKVNTEKTQVVQTKQEEMRQKFLDWIWSDMKRRESLVRKYNDEMNNIVDREYDGSKIRFVGMSSAITLMEHQKNAAARIIYDGNTLLAHVVGAGKTFTMIAAAMEKKRLGLCNKPLFVVPNHLVEQWAGEFARLYPFANVLITSKKDFSKKNRKEFCSRIATGNWDAVIMSHEQFKSIPLSVERQQMEIEKQLEEINYSLSELNVVDKNIHFTVKKYTVTQLESAMKKLQNRLEKLLDSKKDDTITFEQLGIDCLFLDEAHLFKNLAVYTKMNNVAGLTNANSKKASELLMKTNYLNEITGYKGIVFATGTPISNAICELYVMQKYLQERDLQSHHIYSFDSWISRFAETETKVEVKPEGTGYRTVTRVCKYHNLPELMSILRLIADIRVADQLNLDVPERRDHNIAVNPSDTQKDIVKSFADRAENIRSGNVDRQTDNMLCVTNDGRKLAIDARLYDGNLADDRKSKLNRMTRTVFKIWHRTEMKKATQLIFSDLGTPKNRIDKNINQSFDVYNDIKVKLISFGVPSQEIAFIHEANTDEKKKSLFEKVNKGDVRILIGSTEKLGAGTNVQKRLIAIHNLDCPWRPSDLEQRAGRIVRQGNMFKVVYIYSYVTKNTFDTYLYQTVLNKAEPISQIMSSKKPQRDMIDIDTACLNYAEIKALSTGNPAIKEKMELEEKVAKLKILRSNYTSEKYDLESKVKVYIPHKIQACEAKIFALKEDIKTLEAYPVDEETHFSPMTLNNTVFTEKKKALEILMFILEKAAISEEKKVGYYRGLEMTMKYDMQKDVTVLYLHSTNNRFCYPIVMGDSGIGNITRINNTLDNLPLGIEKLKNTLNTLKNDLKDAEKQYEKPFEQEQEYQDSVKRLNELNAKLAIDGSAGIENIAD